MRSGAVQAGEARAPPAIETHFLEGLILRTPIEVIGHRSFVAYYPRLGCVSDSKYAIWFRKRQRINEQRIDYAEYRTVSTDADASVMTAIT